MYRTYTPCCEWRRRGKWWRQRQPAERRQPQWRRRTWAPSARSASSPAGTWCGWWESKGPEHLRENTDRLFHGTPDVIWLLQSQVTFDHWVSQAVFVHKHLCVPKYNPCSISSSYLIHWWSVYCEMLVVCSVHVQLGEKPLLGGYSSASFYFYPCERGHCSPLRAAKDDNRPLGLFVF